MRRGLGGRQGAPVLDEVAEVGVLLLADRRLERDRLLADLHDLADLLGGDHHLLALGHCLGDLLDRRLTAQLLEQLTRDPDEPVDRLDHVDRDADRACLVGDRARDRLPDPPRGVGGELEALLVVELLDCPDQADVSLLDQVQEGHPAPDVLLGDRDDQAQVGRRQLLARVAADLDDLALAVAQLRAERYLRVEAHVLEEVGVVAGLDPALERREGDVVAGPVVDGTQADVVARIEITVVNRKVGPVEERDEGVRGLRLAVRRQELLGLAEQHLRAVRLGRPARLEEVEVRVRDKELAGPLVRDRRLHHPVRLIAEGKLVLRLERPGLALRLVQGPLVEADDRLRRAPRPSTPRARSPWPGRPPPRRSGGQPSRSP